MAIACLLLMISLVPGANGTILLSGKYHSAVDGSAVKQARAGVAVPPGPTAVISITSLLL